VSLAMKNDKCCNDGGHFPVGIGGINIFGTSVLNALGILAVMLLSFKAGPEWERLSE